MRQAERYDSEHEECGIGGEIAECLTFANDCECRSAQTIEEYLGPHESGGYCIGKRDKEKDDSKPACNRKSGNELRHSICDVLKYNANIRKCYSIKNI